MTVGYIIAEPPKKNGNATEAIDTAGPLAASLGLTIDTSWYVYCVATHPSSSTLDRCPIADETTRIVSETP